MPLKKKNSSANPDLHWLRKIEQTSDKRMAWNFSFLSNEDGFNFSNEDLNTDLMLKRIAEINQRTFTAFLNLPRATGLEKIDDELSNQAQLFAEENFTWTFPSQDLAWTVI